MLSLLGIGLLILLGVIALSIMVKRDEKKEKEYRSEYVTEVVINDEVFGEMKFEKDSKWNTLTCKNFPRLLGKYKPTIEIEDYDENNHELYFRSLECIYGMYDEMMETFLEGFLEAYASSEEVTRERLEENIDIETIVFSKRDEYFMAETSLIKGDELETPEGEWILAVCSNPNKNKLFRNYYGSFPVAYMDCRTKEVCYVLDE